MIARREREPDWLQERLDRINELLQLESNWDSYGAAAVDRFSVAVARSLLRQLALIETVEAPTITASPEGNVVLCWDNGGRALDVDILPNGTFTYAYMNENDAGKDREGHSAKSLLLVHLLTQW